MKKKIIPILLYFIALASFSQTKIQGIIVEKHTKLPIAFASVLYEKGNRQFGVISDIYGKFELESDAFEQLTISCVGYKTVRISEDKTTKKGIYVIELEVKDVEIDEVKVTPANNPAIAVVRKTITNKRQNDFFNYEKFSYRAYIKNIIDLKLGSDANSADSLALKDNNEISDKAGFIAEYVILTKKAAGNEENKIIAHQTSGFKDVLLAQNFVTAFHHAISFYSNSIALFAVPFESDKSVAEFVSPLADNSLSLYNFQLNEKYLAGSDTIFVIDFYPKKGRNFNGFKGKMYVNSAGYAIQHIIAEPADKGLIAFKFRQDYGIVQGKWFPTKLYQEIGWEKNTVGKNLNAYPVYLITSVLDSIDFRNPVKPADINLEKVYTDKNLLRNSFEIIHSIRPDALNIRELNTYTFLDSIGKKRNFDFAVRLIPKLAEGKIPARWVDIGLAKLINTNTLEGTRLGLGLYTNEKLSENLVVGGFAGYGLNDKTIKYGGELVWDIVKYHEIRLKIQYNNNLQVLGSNSSTSQFLSSDYLLSYVGSKFERIEEYDIALSFRTFRFFKIYSSLVSRTVTPLYRNYFNSTELIQYKTDEFKLAIKYAFGEETYTLGNQRLTNYQGNPVINMTYSRGINLLSANSFNYNKLEASCYFSAYNGSLGQSKFLLAAGIIDRPLPYGLVFSGLGTNTGKFSLLINNSFQTMQPNEFISDAYVNLFYSHNFGTLLLKTKKFKPQIIMVQNVGWGTIQQPINYGIEYKTLQKGYFETGLVINNIFRFKLMNLAYLGTGLGCFYRFGNYANANYMNNIAAKLSLTLSLN